MAENLEVSRIGVQFGDDFAGDGKSFLKASLVISKEEADSQISNLQSQTGNNLDYNYGLILGINSSPENTEKLHDFLKGLFAEEGPLNQLVGGKAEFKSTVSNGKVWISLKPAGEMEEMIAGPLGFVLQSGLDVVAQTQRNSVELNLTSSREPLDIITLIKNGDSPASALLDSARLEVKLSVNKDLPEALKNSLSAIDPSISSSPLMFFLQYFKTLDIDLRFGSTAELPEQFRKYLLNKKTHLGETSNPLIQEFISLSDGEVELYVTVPEFAAVKISGRAHQISGLLHAVVEAQANL